MQSVFERHTGLAASITLAAAIAPWAAIDLGVQLVVLAIAVVLLGLPHGAYDAWTILDRAPTRRRAVTGLAVYLGVVAAVFAVWGLAPVMALAAFFLMSIAHFGRGDERVASFGLPGFTPALVRGSWVVMGPVAFHGAALEPVFAVLARDAAMGTSIVETASMLRIPLAVAWLGLGALALRRRRVPRGPVAAEVLALGVLVVGAPPLLAFGLYFCLWHSARHLLRERVRGTTWTRMALRSLPATLGTLVLAALVGPWLGSGNATDRLIYLLFVGLAAVSVPHVFLVDGMPPAGRLGWTARALD